MEADLLSLTAAFKARPAPAPAELRAHCLWPRELNSLSALSGHQSPGSQADQRLQCPVCLHTALARAERPRRTQKTEPCSCCCFCPLSQAALPASPRGKPACWLLFSDSQIQGGSWGTVNSPQGGSVSGNPELPPLSVCFLAPDRILLCVAFYFWVFVATVDFL